ncbi:Deoxyadenosine kinase / Deoxyguanosine kinase [Thioalkalivibrio nitratireducens DSM 14787]|uniref:Deoxyadenosine kinase / Deoxyguanosine kinase n=1 Tax=Thioalkalivibrio nitratireducens (strain DSM 14787 / UNIQEM 213 / ALEN2) TaxID=1255043 RepID=L0DZN5_THIND|nr:deoxynucleoside kinase [Thioalkalivibrio nitratireducens]AGA34452.1 Deoxyadenosine kinase / Deoxyguanosine kinase [Thioalkalivibrio nitratireducens DSM 14787]
MSLGDFRFVAVEGPIGVGKSSLARMLVQHLGAEALFEEPDENPFLERFYVDRSRYALATQLHFLVQRVRQLKPVAQMRLFERLHVADYLVDKDPLFAELNLSPDEIEIYHEMFRQLRPQLPGPDLVVYLQAPVDVLLERIRHRGRAYERHIDATYLERLNAAYTEFFYHFDTAALVIVNAAEIDWVNSDSDFRQLVQFLEQVPGGRHYFNPLPIHL